MKSSAPISVVAGMMMAMLSARADEARFSAEDVLRGVSAFQETCTNSSTVWVEGKGDCLRFYGAQAGSPASSPLIYLGGDVVQQEGSITDPPTWKVPDEYTRLSPAVMQHRAERYASATARTYINLARPGIFGSSGNHLQRRREREVALVSGAIDLLKERFGWRMIDLAGFSGGGHLVAALMARRDDIGCAKIGSGNVAVRQRAKESGLTMDVTGYTDFVDPIDHTDAVARHPPNKVIVLTDPQDRNVSASSQGAYVSALRASGVPVDHRFVSAEDHLHHDLGLWAIMAGLACQSAKVSEQ